MRKVILAKMIFFMFSLVLSVSPGFAGEPKSGGTLRIGTRIPQFDRIDVRYPTTASMVPAYDLIYERFFDWGKQGFDKLVPRLATSYETKDGGGRQSQPRLVYHHTERVAPRGE
jgi:ABC-type transport system substrate-binding protein